MKNIAVERQKQRLDDLFQKVEDLFIRSRDIEDKDITDDELQSHLAKYLCVLVSGYIETSLRAIYSRYANEKTNPAVANYVSSRLRNFRNPNTERILQLARAFDPQWAKELEERIEQDELAQAIDSIVATRNGIAHGENVGISYVRIRGYYSKAVKLVDLIQNQCHPSG